MNVVIVSETANARGGAERVALLSARGLAERGHRVTVVAAYGPIEESLAGLPNLTVQVADEGAPPPPSHGLKAFGRIWSSRAGALMQSVIQEAAGETVVHYHCGYMLMTASAFGPIARSKLPVVYTHHEYAWACPLQGFYNYRTQAPCGQIAGSLGCVGTHCNKNMYVGKALEHARHGIAFRGSGFRNRVCRHLFVSSFSARILERYLPKGASSQVLRNPIQVQDLGRAEIKDDAPFVYVGRMTSEKDPLLLARAAAKIQAPVLFVGDGPLASEIKMVNPGAEITGWIEPEKARELIAKATAVVMTSRWYETQGMVVPEAKAAGIPAIVPDSSAASDAVADGETGVIFRSGDEDDLVRALNAVSQSGRARQMGAEAYRRFWADPPTLDRHLDELERVYAACLGGPP